MTRNLKSILATSFALVATTASAQADGSVNGEIRAASDNKFLVCFQPDFSPATDADFSVLRQVVVAAPKNESPIRSVSVGVVRIVHVNSTNCAEAVVVWGNARVHDRVTTKAPLLHP